MRRSSLGVPTARYLQTMAYDSLRQVIVMFGGVGQTQVLNDTWIWDGINWTQRQGTVNPPAVNTYNLCYDTQRSRMVLFGGASGKPGETWEWDGTSWRQRLTTTAPEAGVTRTIFDERRGRVVMSRSTTGDRLETWEYAVPCDAIGEGHVGGGLAVACDAVPTVSRKFCMSFASGAGVALLAMGQAPCPAQPTTLLPPTLCRQGFFFPLPILVLVDGGNPASFCFDVPNDPALAGASFCMQGAAWQAASCLELTDGWVVTIQSR
jgi:hypothetical protein